MNDCTYIYLRFGYNYTKNIYIYDLGSAGPILRPFLVGVGMVVSFSPPCGAVGSVDGSACYDSYLPPSVPLWYGMGSGFRGLVTPCIFGSALGIWYIYTYDNDNNDINDNYYFQY